MPSLLQILNGQPAPPLVLAPMQDVTHHAFIHLMQRYGGPDFFVTEYFRVHPTSRLERHILKSVDDNQTGKPVVAQMIGNDIPALTRSARELEKHPVAAIDLNLGCPAPVVYRKRAGGGLLREPDTIDAILGNLRQAVEGPLTVKTRIGFENDSDWSRILDIFARHDLQAVTVHGRTVTEMYRSEVHYDRIAMAVERLSCPVFANGNVYGPDKAEAVLQETGARGLMIGRGAIRNPWIFQQVRSHLENTPFVIPTGRDALEYVHLLYETVTDPGAPESSRIQRMKRYLNFIGIGIDEEGQFLHAIRRVREEKEMFGLFQEFMDHPNPMPLHPFQPPLGDRDVLAGCHT